MNGAEAFTKQGAELLAQSSGCSVWKFRNETGDGTMTCYELFDGVQLFYNDFHMEYVDSGYVPQMAFLWQITAARGEWNMNMPKTHFLILKPTT